MEQMWPSRNWVWNHWCRWTDLLIRLCVEQVKASSANQLQNWTQGVPAPAHTLNPVWLRPGQTSAHTQAQGAIVALVQLRRWTHLQATYELLINRVIRLQESKGKSHVTFSGTCEVPYLHTKSSWKTVFYIRGHWLAGQPFNTKKISNIG